MMDDQPRARRPLASPDATDALRPHRHHMDTTKERDELMATVSGRKAELTKLTKLEEKWSFYRSLCQFRLGYFSFLVMMCILMFSFTFLMEIFFAIFLPSARADPHFTVRAIFLLAALPFVLILLSYVFEESSRLFFDAIDKSEGSMANFRLSLTVVFHYLRHYDEMPEDRVSHELSSQYQVVDTDAVAWQKFIGSIQWLFWRITHAFVTNDPFDDKDKEQEDKKREEIEDSYTRAHAAVLKRDDKVADEDAEDAKDRWKKAMGAAHTAAIFTKTQFDGPPLDFSTLVAVDVLCPMLFEVTTLYCFVTKLLARLSPMEAFLDYLQTGFYVVSFYLGLWLFCHFWSSRNQKMREFVSNYRRRRRNLERALQVMETEKKSEQLWLVDIGFRAYEYFQSLFYEIVRIVLRFFGPSRRHGTDAERLPLTTSEAVAASTELAAEAKTTTTTDANETVEAIEGKYRLQEIKDKIADWNPWTKFSHGRRLVILTPIAVISAIISFGSFTIGWALMGFTLILLANAIQGKFPQIFGSAFRYFISSFVILSFVFFSSTWAIGTFVLGGDFKVYPPAGPNATALQPVNVINVPSIWGKVAQYPVCSLDFSTLDIVDFALIADSIYGYNTSVQYQSFDERFKGTELADWQYVVRNNETVDHHVWVELFFPTINMTVVAVRGTASVADALQDLHFWFGISIMQAVNVFVPFLKQLPDKFVVEMLSNTLLDKIMPPPVYQDMLNHVVQVKKRVGDRLVLTGHSLGGAMAGMIGAKTKTPAVSFSGPGLLFTRGRFGISEADIRDYVLTIKPRSDVVPQVDELAGMVQEIECRRSNPLACHSTQTHLCELYVACGDRRNRDWSAATQCIDYLNPQ